MQQLNQVKFKAIFIGNSKSGDEIWEKPVEGCYKMEIFDVTDSFIQ